MPNTNSNTPEGETTPNETNVESSFTGFDDNYSFFDHLKAEKAGTDRDFELSKRSCNPQKTGESITDDSHFSGKDTKPFQTKVEPPVVVQGEKIPQRKGIDYRDKNNSSLL